MRESTSVRSIILDPDGITSFSTSNGTIAKFHGITDIPLDISFISLTPWHTTRYQIIRFFLSKPLLKYGRCNIRTTLVGTMPTMLPYLDGCYTHPLLQHVMHQYWHDAKQISHKYPLWSTCNQFSGMLAFSPWGLFAMIVVTILTLLILWTVVNLVSTIFIIRTAVIGEISQIRMSTHATIPTTIWQDSTVSASIDGLILGCHHVLLEETGLHATLVDKWK